MPYLHNAQGQRVFKSEPVADNPNPDPATVDPSFIDWLHTRFVWLFGTTKKSDKTKLSKAFFYEGTDLLGEYGTGGAANTGSTEYIYLPTEQGNVLVGAVINGEKYAVHTDHLNTPRRMTDAANQPVWQWSYSAFGDNEPSISARNFKDRSWAFAKGELTDLQDGVDNADNGPAFGNKMVKHVGLTLRMIDDEDGKPSTTVLIEGSALALRMLAELIVAVANESENEGFSISPFGAGSDHFSKSSKLGVYIHRLAD